jgi:hypothetical protein
MIHRRYPVSSTPWPGFGRPARPPRQTTTASRVMLTLLANAFPERRRAGDTRWLESVRLAAQRSSALRDERQKAYGGLSIAGERVLRFMNDPL